jgi:hypothetical protein
MLAKAGLGLRFNEHLEGDGPTVKMKNPEAPAVTDRVVHLRHHLFAFAQRLVAVGAAQPSELVGRWADVYGGRVARV